MSSPPERGLFRLEQRLLASMLAVLVAFGLCSATSIAAEGQRPNIVFILMDDLRFDELGCTGHPFVKTPNIDRLAREGAIFTNAFATTPLCSPSRASFLTGLYAHTHGIIDNTDRSPLSHALVTSRGCCTTRATRRPTSASGTWASMTRRGRASTRWVGVKGQGDVHRSRDQRRRPGKRGRATSRTSSTSARSRSSSGRTTKPFLLYLSPTRRSIPTWSSGADGRISDPSAGDFFPPSGTGGSMPTPTVPAAPTPFAAARGKPALRARSTACRRSAGDTATERRDDPQPAAACCMAVDDGVGRILDALEETGQARRDADRLHQRPRLLLRRARPERRAPAGLRGGDPHPAADALSAAHQAGARRSTPFVLSIDLPRRCSSSAASRVPERLHGRSLVPLLEGRDPTSPGRRS